MKCKICNINVGYKIKKSRSGEKLKIYNCKKCDFEFHNFENLNISLANNKLDKSRLRSVGIDELNIQENFQNSLEQGKIYYSKYIKNKKIKILDIGCGYGGFLKVCKDKGNEVVGIEINKKLRNFIKKNLDISCLKNMNDISIKNTKFDLIFMFYSFEYIKSLKNFYNDLKNLFHEKTKVIILTPNKNDYLFKLKIKNYLDFFYDKHSINYFSVNSLKVFFNNFNERFYIKTIQGYSYYNFLNWIVVGKPLKNKFVAMDNIKNIDTNPDMKRDHFISKFKLLNNEYKKTCENQNYGNIIEIVISNY